MKTTIKLCGIGVAILAAGCASISVGTDFNPGADFASYRSFQWIPRPQNLTGGSAREAMQDNSLLDKRIKRAVASQLTAKGLVESSENPGLLVTYHTGVKDKIRVSDWGYAYPGPGVGWGRSIDVYQYQEGTLVIDLVDATTQELVWRGKAQAVLSKSANPEKDQKLIDEAVAKMLANFPPKKS